MATKPPPYVLSEHIEALNSLSALRTGEVEVILEPDGPLFLGLDEDDEPVERDGGGIGNLLILGKSSHRWRLEQTILRSIQVIRPQWDAPYSVINESRSDFDEFIENQPDGKGDLLAKAAVQGILVERTLNAVRYFGPDALLTQVELAYTTMEENREFMQKHDLSEVPDEMVHTLHIGQLDRLKPQNDSEGIYTLLGELAMNSSMEYGVNLILSADDPNRITRTLRDNVLILSLHQENQRVSQSVIGYPGMELALPYVAAIETRSGAVRAFRF